VGSFLRRDFHCTLLEDHYGLSAVRFQLVVSSLRYSQSFLFVRLKEHVVLCAGLRLWFLGQLPLGNFHVIIAWGWRVHDLAGLHDTET
jgi:hypothetical protein